MLKLTKFPHPYGGGFKFYYTKYFLNRFIPHVYRARPTHGFWPSSKKVRIGPKIEYIMFCWQPEMEIPSFSQRTGLGPLGPVRKSYRWMGLRNGISIGIREKHIRIGNKFDCVEGVTPVAGSIFCVENRAIFSESFFRREIPSIEDGSNYSLYEEISLDLK